ncbi:MAG: DUF6036 family nucleotidyltransferase [Anaerolineae bacterium]
MSPRRAVDRRRIETFLQKLGARFRHRGRVYLVGGTTLVFEGFRQQTLDIDLTFDLEPAHHAEFIQIVRELKEELALNVEEVSPGDFIPLPSGYMERSQFIDRFNQIEVFHFDLYSTALSKIARGTEEDFSDVLTLLRGGRITLQQLETYFTEIQPQIATASLKQNPAEFQRKFQALVDMWMA